MEGSAGTAAPPQGETPGSPPPSPTQPTPSPPPAPTPPPTPDPTPPAAGGKQETAAEKRIRELNERTKAAEQRAKEAEDALKAKQREEMGDVERARAEAEEARNEANEAKARATSLERGAWARTAASAAGFIDAEDAVQMLDLSSLDTETKVKNAVDKLKEQKPHLVGTTGGQPGGGNVPPPGFGNLGGSGQSDPEVPVGADGEPDVKLGLGRDLLAGLTGRRRP